MRFPQPTSYTRLYRGPAALAAAIVLIPLLARGDYSYLLPLMQLAGIYSIIVIGLTLLLGQAGQVSLGHAGFYALGAYSAGVLTAVFHAPLWIATAAGPAAAALLALVVGLSILRLKGFHLSLATLCIGVILYELITRMQITGGAAGLYDLPEMRGFGLFPVTPLGKVYFIWTVVLLVVVWTVHLSESPAGRAMRAVHGDEDAAEALGVSAFSVKLKIFVLSAALAGLAGVLYAFVYTPSYLGPEEFGLMASVTLVTMAVVGGMGSVWGAVAGALLMTGMSEVITLVSERLGSTDSAKFEQLVFGLILVLIMLFSRDGLTGGARRTGARLARRWR